MLYYCQTVFYETSKLNKVQYVMHGTVYALVNNIPEIPAMEAQCKQRDVVSFPFHFKVSCTNQLRSYLNC